MRIAFAVEGSTPAQGIWVMQADGKDSRVPPTSRDDTQPAWSPDGSEIAFQRQDSPTQTDSILVVPSGGGQTTTLTSDLGVSDLEPAWSPDGSRILFVSDRPDTPSRDESDPAWSPDGRKIVYSANGAFHGASSSQLYVAKADGTQRHILTHAWGECAWINDYPSPQPIG